MTFYSLDRVIARPSLWSRARTFYRTNRMAISVFQWWITLILYGAMGVAFLAALKP